MSIIRSNLDSYCGCFVSVFCGTAELVATHQCLDKKHSFSGQQADTKYVAWGDMASLKLQAMPELRQKALDALKEEEAQIAKLLKIKAASR